MEHEETSHLELDLSGGDMPELVLELDPRLQPISRHRKGLPREGRPGEDVSEDQLYLPVHSDPDSTPQMIQVSTLEQPGNTSGMVSMSNAVEKSHRRETD